MSSTRRVQVDFHRRRLGKAYRGRNAMMLCTCHRCMEGALPGDAGCWIQKWEVEKHVLQQELDAQPMYQRGKMRRGVLASHRALGRGRLLGNNDREMRGEGSSKRARLEQSEKEIDNKAPAPDIPSNAAHSHPSGSDEADQGRGA